MRRPPGLPPQVLSVARRQGGLLAVAQCEALGVTKKQRELRVRRAEWTRPARGVVDTKVVDGRLHRNDVDRLRQAWTGTLAHPDAVPVGTSALVLHGVKGLPREFTPEIVLPRGRRGREGGGVLVRQYATELAPFTVNGRNVAAITSAFTQALPSLPRFHAVAALDSALNQRLIDDAGMAEVRRLLTGRRGAVRARALLDQVDGRSESPPETFLRLQCCDAGIRPDDLQRDVHDDRGRFLGRGDALWYLGDGRWLIVEMDSVQFHTGNDALRRDTGRQNGLTGTGAIVLLRFYADQLWPAGAVTSEIASLLRRHGWAAGRALPAPR